MIDSTDEDSDSEEDDIDCTVDSTTIREQNDTMLLNDPESEFSENEIEDIVKDPDWVAHLEDDETDSSDVDEIDDGESLGETSKRDVR